MKTVFAHDHIGKRVMGEVMALSSILMPKSLADYDVVLIRIESGVVVAVAVTGSLVHLTPALQQLLHRGARVRINIFFESLDRTTRGYRYANIEWSFEEIARDSPPLGPTRPSIESDEVFV